MIDAAELALGDGLTVITGETGAGKTVLSNALALLAGAAAGAGTVRPGHRQAIVQATIAVGSRFWDALDDDDPACAVRELTEDPLEFTVTRKIPVDGRARSFIDGTAAPRAAVAALLAHVVRFSAQGDQRALTAPRAQLAAIDRYCGPEVAALAERVAHTRRVIREEDRARARERESRAERQRRIDELDEMVAQCDALAPEPDEYDALLAERERLRHADRLIRAAAGAADAIAPSERDTGARELVGQARRAIGDVVAIDPGLVPVLDQLEAAQIAIAEASVGIGRYLDGLDVQPGRLDAVETRLDQYARLALRCGCTASEVAEHADRARSERDALRAGVGDDAAGTSAREAAMERLRADAAQLGQQRAEGARRLCVDLRAVLARLAMPDVRVRVELDDPEDPLEPSRALMFVQPNPGLPEAPLSEVASGGELSRVLLAIHSLTGGGDDTTWIFDEIDAGIGGTTAAAVATLLASFGRSRQTIAITHLVQVAAAADRHFVLDKSVGSEGVARTEIREVTGAGRIDELCRMVGASPRDRAARTHVEALVAAAGTRETSETVGAP